MRNGMAIFEVTDTDRKAVFIDEDTLETARLSAMLKDNRERNEAERKKVERKHRMIAEQKRKWKEYTVDTFSYIGIRGAIAGGSVWAMIGGLISPVIAIPVAVYCLGVACIRFGVWCGSKH